MKNIFILLIMILLLAGCAFINKDTNDNVTKKKKTIISNDGVINIPNNLEQPNY